MPLKKYKPTTPSRRFMVLSNFEEITKDTPERSLVKAKKSRAGRNSAGRIYLFTFDLIVKPMCR